METIERQNLLVDKLNGVPLIVVLGEDKKSVRAFETSVDGRELEFFVKADAGAWRMFDGETRSK